MFNVILDKSCILISSRNLIAQISPKNFIYFLVIALTLDIVEEAKKELCGILLHWCIYRLPIEANTVYETFRVYSIFDRTVKAHEHLFQFKDLSLFDVLLLHHIIFGILKKEFREFCMVDLLEQWIDIACRSKISQSKILSFLEINIIFFFGPGLYPDIDDIFTKEQHKPFLIITQNI